MNSLRILPVLAVAALPLLGLTGCNTVPGIRADMTNHADSTTRSSEQDANDYARIIDHNTRMAWDDLARILLLDKTSRQSPWIAP